MTVVDDQSEALDLLREILEPAGYVVSGTTRVGPELHEILGTRPDLVIVDLLLATDQRLLSGWDVVRLVRSHAELYRVPVLVMSGNHRVLRSIAGEAQRMGNLTLLAKPFAVDELRAAVAGLLGPSAELQASPVPATS